MHYSRLLRQTTVARVILAATCIGILAAQSASAQSPSEQPPSARPGAINVTLWTASAGAPDVVAPIKKWIADFNASQSTYNVELTAFPDANYAYTDTVVAAAPSKNPPRILHVDGPNISSLA